MSPWAQLGTPCAIVRPRSTEQVAAVLRAAHAAGGSVVPWGGRMGLVALRPHWGLGRARVVAST